MAHTPTMVACQRLVLCLAVVFCGAVSAQPQNVRAENSGAGYYMTADGSALYWNDKDGTAGAPTCVEECVQTWPPLLAPENAQQTSDWSVVERPDGVRQWAYRGKPLYRYVQDTFPGARLGDEVGRIWHIMFEPTDVPAGMTIESTLLGRVLADYRGRTLYAAPSEAPATAEDSGSWTAFTAPWLAKGRADWSIQAHPDGTRQWAYKGQPLFTYEKDTDPQDIRGHGLAGRSAVILEPAPGLPSWVTVQQVDLGQVYADERGMTVYAPLNMEQIITAQTCPADCMQKYWRPILAAEDETSIGDWVILDNDAGERQWSFKGRLLFTHTRDKKPGEMAGNGHAVGYRIGDGFRVILVDPRLRSRG